MEIEFDPDKDVANIAKHGISLKRVADFRVLIVEPVVRNGERRLHAIGIIGDEHYSLAFVFRRNVVRPISLRRAHEEEVEKVARKDKGLAEEGVAFERDGVVFDEDNPEWTDERIARAVPVEDLPLKLRDAILAAFPQTKLRGPQKAPTKVPISLRLSREVVDYYRATGEGWQTRIDEALKDLIKKAG